MSSSPFPTASCAAGPAAASAPDTTTPWVVCLCAEWCGACREYQSVFEQVARAHPGLRFAWVDVEDHADLADDFDVETFPTLLIASTSGTHFLGPLLPHAETLARMLAAMPAAKPVEPEIRALLEAIAVRPTAFAVDSPGAGA